MFRNNSPLPVLVTGHHPIQLTMYPLVLMVLLLVLLWIRMDAGDQTTDLQKYRLQTWLNVTQFESQQLANQSLSTPLSDLQFTGVEPAKDSSVLNMFIPKALEQDITSIWKTKEKDSVYYTNMNSILHGRYVQGPKSEKVHMSISRYNLTLTKKPLELEKSGKIQLNLDEVLKNGSAGFIQATAYFADIPADLYGFHLGDGKIALSTKSLKFSGLKALPFLLPSSSESGGISTPGAQDAKILLHDMINNDTTEYSYSDFEDRIEATTKCEWVIYGKFRPARVSQGEMDAIEEELSDPIGRPIPKVPKVKLSGVMYSPDCGISATINADGERTEQFKSRLRHGLVGLLAVFVCVYILATLQVQRISTPTANFRISFWSVALTVLADGVVFMVCMLGTYRKEVALQLMAIIVVIFCFVTTVQFDFMTSIFQAQLGEGGSSADLTYTQVSALINSRMYISIVFMCLLIISSYGFNDRNRKAVEWMVTILLYANWWPQIYRNARRGFSRPLSLKFIYFTSILRLVPLMYICFYSHNVGYHGYDPNLGFALIGWQWVQVLILTSQYFLGGQFFVPSGFIIDGHDYHPILNTDLEALLHTSELPVEETENGTKRVDCPICMTPVDLVTSDANSAATILARRAYMVTPCRHIFHTECLEEWMLRKLECPVCRTRLPST